MGFAGAANTGTATETEWLAFLHGLNIVPLQINIDAQELVSALTV